MKATNPFAPRRARKAAKPFKLVEAFSPIRALEGIRDLPVGARLVLPFPPTELNPNSRVNRYAKSAAAKKYRDICWAGALEAFGCIRPYAFIETEGPIPFVLDFFPPNGARRDDDNCEAAFKWGRDGVASALGFDDSRLVLKGRTLHPYARGCVVMTFVSGDAA